MKILKVLIGCEESQAICKEFRALGHEAYSCDLLQCSGGHPEWHLQMDVFKAIQGGYLKLESGEQIYIKKWDAGIFHPTCTFMTNSGVRWLYNPDKTHNIERWKKLSDAIHFFNEIRKKCILNEIESFALENPIPHKYAVEGFSGIDGIGLYDQLIQPWQFGDTTSKSTCLWLTNLPKLQYTNIIDKQERTFEIHKCAPGPDRAKIRSKTFPGIAKAIAKQWSDYLCNNYATL